MSRLPKLALVLLAAAVPALAPARTHVLIVAGLGGQEVYGQQFNQQAAAMAKASKSLGDDVEVRVLQGAEATRANVQSALQAVAGRAAPDDRLIAYLVGHGSYDGEEYKFNVPGPDFTGGELAGWLNALPFGEQLVIATGSSSGALQDSLKKANRVVLTATRSGSERNVTRFGGELAAALADQGADTDKNGVLNAQEAFDFAQRGVKSFYEKEARLASEHSQAGGERANRFNLARFATANGGGAAGGGAAPAVVDSPERQRINLAIEQLRARKAEMPEAEYNGKLEALLLELAVLDAGAAAGAPR